MREMKYKVTAENLQNVFNHFGIDVDIKADARSLIITSAAPQDHFMTEFMRVK